MLEGLEASVIRKSELERTLRVDSEYFLRRHRLVQAELVRRPVRSLTKAVSISDGNHFAVSEEFCEEGVPYYRGQDAVGHFFIEHSMPMFIPHAAFALPHMTRSHLCKGDVLLSIVGSIGSTSLVTSERPATCSCKLAILRPKRESISAECLAVFLHSRHGACQVERLTRGAIQMSLLLEDMDQILVPILSPRFQSAVAETVQAAYRARCEARQQLEQAEATLLDALGLPDWQPPEPLTYMRSSKEVLAAERLDAEHFREKYAAAHAALARAGATKFLSLSDLLAELTNGHTPLRHDLTQGDVPFLCAEHVTDFKVDFHCEKRVLKAHHEKELGRTALKNGDLLLTIKGRVGNVGLVENVPEAANINQDVALLRLNKKLPKWYVLAYLNSLFGKLQVEKYCTGGINPFLALANVRRLEIPLLPKEMMAAVAKDTERAVHSAFGEEEHGKALLARAQRAVEVAIEEGEAAGLAHLKGGGDGE